ncbi:hypothetical protein HK405_008373, partial [Cladochytrium tenue]
WSGYALQVQMFVQRVLTVYQQKVAQDRAEKLLHKFDEEHANQALLEKAQKNKNQIKKSPLLSTFQAEKEEVREQEKREEERLRAKREMKADEERFCEEAERACKEEERQRQREVEERKQRAHEERKRQEKAA